MKLPMNKLVVAMALAAFAGQAGAAMVQSDTGNGDLFLTVWDTNNTVMYTQDLGQGFLSWMPNGVSVSTAVSGDATTDVGTATPEAGLTNTFTTNFGSAFATINQTTDPLLWNVVGADSKVNPASSYRVNGAVQIMTTSATSAPISTTTSEINTLGGNVEAQMIALNGIGCGTASSCVDTLPGTSPFNFGATNNFGNSIGSGAFNNAGAIGQSLYADYLTGSGGAPSTAANVLVYQNSQNLATWTLNSSGTLVYSLAPAVSSVPIPAAVWLFGSGLLGLVGIARRKLA